jgi:glutamyl-tRNA reductase
MMFQLIGVNHRSAPLEVRERFAIPEARLPDAVARLAKFPGVKEALVVSTCNRTDLLARSCNGSLDLRAFLADYLQIPTTEFESYVYEHSAGDAIRHLFRVTASLDSMVIGEPQILGQVKEAYAVARAAGAIHSHLDALVTRAFAVAKKVRRETSVGSSAVSVASVAVELAQKIFGSLKGLTVYLVGAGKMSELAARHLIEHGADTIYVANRTPERAQQLAHEFRGHAVPFEQLYATVDRADIVITSTAAPHLIFRREHGELFLRRRRNRPMFFIDIAVPRDVDAELNKLDRLFVYDIDDLQSVASSHLADRRREAERAEAIVAAEVERFSARLQVLDVVPTIVSFQEHLETIRQSEIDRVRGRLGPVTPKQELALEALTRGIIKKIMHTPISELKNVAGQPEATTMLDAFCRMFNLPFRQNGEARLAKVETAGAESL